MNYGFKEYLKNKEHDGNYLDKKKKDIIIRKVEDEIDQLRAKYLVDKRNHNDSNTNNYEKENIEVSDKYAKDDNINLLENDNSNVISNEECEQDDNEYNCDRNNDY